MSQYRRILIGVVSLLLYSTVYGSTQPRYTLTDLGINAVPYFDSLSNDGIVAGSVWRTDVDAPAPALSDHGQVSTLPLSGNAYARNNVGSR
jgi:hypothetical protein